MKTVFHPATISLLAFATPLAETMFHGVRVGGAEKFPTSIAWGFGRHSASNSTKRPAPSRDR